MRIASSFSAQLGSFGFINTTVGPVKDGYQNLPGSGYLSSNGKTFAHGAIVEFMANGGLTPMAPVAQMGTMILLIGGIVIAGAGVLGWLFSRTITRPVSRLTATMASLADGDLAIEVEGTGGKDELGAMARAVEVFRENAIRVAEMTEEERAGSDRRRHVGEIATGAHQARQAEDRKPGVSVVPFPDVQFQPVPGRDAMTQRVHWVSRVGVASLRRAR